MNDPHDNAQADREALERYRETLTHATGVARLVGVVQAKAGDPIRFWHVSGRSTCVGTYASEDVAARIRPWWRSDSKWGLLLTDAVLLPEPIPMRGAGGVWRIPEVPVQTFEPVGANVLTFTRYAAPWALEQWRKARGA